MFVLLGCQSPDAGKSEKSAADSTYTLTGKIKGMDSGWVYLLHRQSGNELTDSARVNKGQFVLSGRSTGPEFVNIGTSQDGSKDFRAGFFLQNGNLGFSGKADSLTDNKLIITGSPTEEEYQTFMKGQQATDSMSTLLDAAYTKAEAKKDKKQEDSILKRYQELSKHTKQTIKEYIASHPSSYFGVFELESYFSYDPDAGELDSLYKRLDTTIQASYYGKKVNEIRLAVLRTAPGQMAPEFSLPDTSGRTVSLSSFKGKYVLVDFWASWCGPCRGENPSVVKAFKKYQPKGFTVLGVSLDEKKDKWEEAIKKDRLDWTQVSDLKGWQTPVGALYGIKGIPMNFLLDKEGKVIAKGLRGEDLENKLAESIH